MRARRSGAPTGAELHRRWLELVDTDGPFLAVPPLRRVWPQGIPPIDPTARAVLAEAKPDFEKAWEAWDRGPKDDAGLAAYRTARDTWVDTVLRDVIGWGNLLILPAAESLGSAEGPDAQLTTITATSPNRSVAIRPSGMLRYNDQTAALVLIVDPC